MSLKNWQLPAHSTAQQRNGLEGSLPPAGICPLSLSLSLSLL